MLTSIAAAGAAATGVQAAGHHMGMPGRGDGVPKLRAPAAQPHAHMRDAAVTARTISSLASSIAAAGL